VVNFYISFHRKMFYTWATLSTEKKTSGALRKDCISQECPVLLDVLHLGLRVMPLVRVGLQISNTDLALTLRSSYLLATEP
jgi:hypothetical protein